MPLPASNRLSLADEEGHGLVSRKHSVVLDNDVFIADHTVERDVRANVGVLKQNAVFDDRSLSDVYTAEEDGILHRSLNHAAVGNQTVLDACALAVLGGCAVADLGIDLSCVIEESAATRFVLEQLH